MRRWSSITDLLNPFMLWSRANSLHVLWLFYMFSGDCDNDGECEVWLTCCLNFVFINAIEHCPEFLTTFANLVLWNLKSPWIKGELVCYQRGAQEAVPGCFGTGSSGSDYCCDRSKFQTELWIRGDELPPGSYGLCEGEINVLLDGGYFHIL